MAAPTLAQQQYFLEHADDNKQANLYAAAICCLVLVWLFVVLRFIARRRIRAGWKSDDWLIVAAALAFSAFPIGMFILLGIGFGKHIIFVTNPQLMVEMVVMCEIAYAVAIPLTKISILSLYNRIFPSRKLFYISIALALISILYSLALAIVCILQCIPLESLWNPLVHGWCMNTTPPYTATAVANVVTDVLILCLPMKFLLGLQMPLQRKIEIVGLFALGGCVCIFGIIRSIEVGTASPVDQSWTTVSGTIWSVVEPCVGIISACLPTMRPLLPFDRESHTGYTDYSQSGSAEQKRRFDRTTMLANKSRGRVWSTVTTGRDPEVGREDVEDYPFADLGPHGKGASTTDVSGENASSDGGRSNGNNRKSSLNDIHVRHEFHAEISRAASAGRDD